MSTVTPEHAAAIGRAVLGWWARMRHAPDPRCRMIEPGSELGRMLDAALAATPSEAP